MVMQHNMSDAVVILHLCCSYYHDNAFCLGPSFFDFDYYGLNFILKFIIRYMMICDI